MALHKALIEVINVLNLCCDRGRLSVTVKASGLQEAEGDTLFRIKLQTDPAEDDHYAGVTLSDCSELVKVFEGMQTTENESHMCTQHLDSNGRVVQRNFCVSHETLVVTDTIKRSPTSEKGFSVHIRILQQQNIVMRECQRVYRFLHAYKVYFPRRNIDFTMKIQDNVCVSDFSNNRTVFVNKDVEICGDTDYFMRDTAYLANDVTTTCACSDPVYISTKYLPNKVCMKAVAIHCPIKGPLHVGGNELFGGSFVRVCFYGPLSIPLLSTSQSNLKNPLEGILWTTYSMKPLQVQAPTAECDLADLFLGQYHLLLRPLGELQGRRDDSGLMMVNLHIDTNAQSAKDVDYELLQWMKRHYAEFVECHYTEVVNAISQAVYKIYERRKGPQIQMDKYSMAIPQIAKSLGSILSRSSDENFRQQCFRMLEVGNASDAEAEIGARLSKMSGEMSCLPSTLEHQQSSNHAHRDQNDSRDESEVDDMMFQAISSFHSSEDMEDYIQHDHFKWKTLM